MEANFIRDATILGVAGANEVTNKSIITLMDLENLVFLGITFGAWFQIVMFISIILIIILNLKKLTTSIVKSIKLKINNKKSKR